MDIQNEIIEIDAKIANAKTYLKKLRQYKRTLAKIQAAKAEIAALEATAPNIEETESTPVTTDGTAEVVEAAAPTDAEIIGNFRAALEATKDMESCVTFPHDNLDNLSIRQLKALAKTHKLPKYGSLTKAELITALTLAGATIPAAA